MTRTDASNDSDRGEQCLGQGRAMTRIGEGAGLADDAGGAEGGGGVVAGAALGAAKLEVEESLLVAAHLAEEA